jgi:RimJ/RimL family protein N-acetyltransferase
LAGRGWAHGFATEAARALLGFGFRELGLHEVRGVTVSANARVVALARRVGLVAVASLPAPAGMQGRGWARTEWRLTREQWERTTVV